MDADGTTKKKAEKDKKSKKDSGRARWAVQVFCISVVLSGALSFASGEVLEGAGLALAFGLDSREELDELAAGRGRAAKAARRAVTRVEEANVQSVYSKDTAQSAKFILQSGFGYGEKQGRKAREDIKVEIEQ